MNKTFGVTELKEVVSELETVYDQCQTCWPTTVFSQGSFTERKVFCCSKFVKADDGKKMSSPEEDSGLFSGVRFLLAGFEPAYENQFIEELEENGGVNAKTYDSSCTHVIVSNLAYDDPICAAARKDCKALVTDAWVADCLHNNALADVNSVLYRPLKDLDGIPGSEEFCFCLTGYHGQERQKIMRMVELMGATFTKPLVANLVTHLICYKFEGEKYELAKITGLNLINHLWLEDCLKSWSLLPEEDYSRSGWEAEKGAKQPKDTKEKAEACSPASQKKVKRTSIPADVPFPCPVEASTSRRDSGMFEKVRSPSAEVNTCSNSAIRSPSSLQKKTGEQVQYDIVQSDATINQVVQLQKLASPEVASSMEGLECVELQGSDIFDEALKIADQREETSPVHVKKSRRSSCGGANQVSPASPSLRGVTAATYQLAYIDCGREEMSICADSVRKKRVSEGEGGEKTELITRENAVDIESPESKRRKSSKLSKSRLSPSSVTKDRLGREQDVPSSSPLTKQVPSPSIASLSGKLKMKQKLLQSGKEIQQDLAPRFDVSEAVRREDMDLEIIQPFEFVTSPDNKRLARDSRLQAVQLKARDSPDDPPFNETSLSNEHTADGASRLSATISIKEVPRTVQTSPPKSPSASEREVDMEEADQTPRSARKSKIPTEKDAKSASKPRKSVNKSSGFVSPKDKDGVNMDSSAVDEVVPSFKDGPAKRSAKKASRAIHSPREPSRKVVGNDNSPVVAEQVLQQNVDTEGMVHEVPFQSIRTKKSAKKASKPSSSWDRSLQKSGGLVYTDHHHEESPDGKIKGAPLDTSRAEKATTAALGVLVSRPKKGSKYSKKGTASACPEETDEQNTNGGSRREDVQLNSTSREKSNSAEAQASLSIKKKSKGRRHMNSDEQDKENVGFLKGQNKDSRRGVAMMEYSKKGTRDSLLRPVAPEMQKYFAVGGSTDQRKNLHYLIKLLGAKVCKSRYEWKDDVTHVVLPVPLRRTEKFLAGAAAGRWILKPEYVEASRNAGKFVDEKEYEWFGEGTNDKGTISLEAPRKWRAQFTTTGCGAFYGLRVVMYGESASPPSGTLKRAIRAGGGFVLATTPPYPQHLVDGVDFAIINPGLVDKDDEHVQEFLKQKVACVTCDYFVDYICHPSASLEKHILYKTNSAVAAAHKRLQKNISRGPNEEVEKLRRAAAQKLSTSLSRRNQVTDDIACVVCGRTDDEMVMLLCGDDKGRGCGLATHIHCCSPPLLEVPDEDWFCRNCEDL